MIKIILILLLINTSFAGHHKKDKSKEEKAPVGSITLEAVDKEFDIRLYRKVHSKWKKRAKKIDIESLSWTIEVPESYNPASPPGILAYMSQTTSGKIPSKSWKNTLNEKNLIYISTNGMKIKDNQQDIHFAILTGIEKLKKQYKINANRIYIAGQGSTSGAKHATSTAIMSSDLFKGAIYINGASTWEKLPVINKPNYYYYSFFGKFHKDKKVHGMSKAVKNAYVFLFNTDNLYAKTVYDNYKKKYFKYLKHIQNDGEFPDEKLLNISIDFLDNPKK